MSNVNTTPRQAFEPTERNRPQPDTIDNANTTPQQAFGPTEATNALVGNAFFGSANINFNGAFSEDLRAQAEKDACLKSLAFGEIHARRHDIADAHSDTCDWLFRTPEFRQWRDPNSRHTHFGVLWIKGKPGAGKSTLMKHAFSCFQKDMFDDHLIVAHFFNARGATIEKTALGLLRSIVYQLLQDEELYSLFQDLLRHKKLSAPTMSWQWRLSELQDFVRSVVRRPRSRPLLLLIDALDECDESQARDVVVFLESLSIYAFQARLPLQICLSSRHYPCIRMNKVIELVIETNQDHQADIATYISDKLRIRDAIMEAEITERASGVFLWVVIVVAMLNKANDEGRVKVMQKTLDEVPNDIDEVFANILNNVSDVAETLLILQWVLLSRRPLTLSELFAAVFQGLASQPIDLMKRRIITSSKGLVEMRSEGSDTMQFIHLSVEDFLYRRKRLSAIDPSLEPEPITISHGRLWARCWACIEQAGTTNISVDEEHMAEVFQKDPFLSYATSNILHHADLALTHEVVKADRDDDFSESSSNILQLSIKKWLLRSDRWFPSWKRFLRLSCNDDMAGIGTAPGSNLVFAAVVYRLSNLLRTLPASDIEAQGRLYGSALQLASARGIYHIALLLVESGVDVNAQGGKYGNTLQAACSQYSVNEQIVRLLLEAGADVNAQGGKYGSALQAASQYSVNEQIVRLLLEAEADVNAQGGEYGSALQAASQYSVNEQIVRLLLEAEADVNAQGGEYGSALQAACSQYSVNEQIVRLLLEAEADVNAQGGEYGSALQAACSQYSVNEQIVRLLLEAEADVNAQGGEYGSALQAACSQYSVNEQIVRLLLEAEADVNAQGGEYGSALQAACSQYSVNEQIVRLLLEAEADVNAQGGEYGSALQAACSQYSVNEQLVRLLLEAGADVNAQGGKYGNTLQAACLSNNEQLVRLLLEAGADVNAQGGEYGSALQVACLSDNEQLVRLLLEAGADINAQGGKYGSALQVACFSEHEQIVRLLLEAGADVNAQGGEYGSALQVACFSEHEQLVRLLLEAGADVNAQGGKYGNALQATCSYTTNRQIVKLLLKAGADANTQSSDRPSTVLEVASSIGCQTTVQLLLDASATASVSDT